jgi:hypothetical protein
MSAITGDITIKNSAKIKINGAKKQAYLLV